MTFSSETVNSHNICPSYYCYTPSVILSEIHTLLMKTRITNAYQVNTTTTAAAAATTTTTTTTTTITPI